MTPTQRLPLVDGAVRLDRWLTAARLYKSRSAAQEACMGGLVKLNGDSAKPSASVKIGDRIEAQAPRGLTIVDVSLLAEKRLAAAQARLLYEDHSPPPPPREERHFELRPRGSGRPTKSDRRDLDRLRGDRW